MEALILGWFVLIATDSAFLLSAFAALNFGGTLLAPFYGVLADRIDRRRMLMALRAIYAALAGVVMMLGLTGVVAPWQLFCIAAVAGLVRPSDLIVRNSLIADTVPNAALRNAMGLSRTTMDSARIAGALLGAGLLSVLGIGAAYGAVTGFYVASILLATGISVRRSRPPSGNRPLAELRSGFNYMRERPAIVGLMSLAFLVNLTAFPISHGLLPVLARDVYGVDANGLAQLVASYALGALAGSLLIAAVARTVRPGRTVGLCIVGWHALLVVLGSTETREAGMALLLVIGTIQSFAMIAMSVLILSATEEDYRGRILGIRMLAVYGLPLGLLGGGALVESAGIATTFALYGTVGILATGAILRWRPEVMRL